MGARLLRGQCLNLKPELEQAALCHLRRQINAGQISCRLIRQYHLFRRQRPRALALVVRNGRLAGVARAGQPQRELVAEDSVSRQWHRGCLHGRRVVIAGQVRPHLHPHVQLAPVGLLALAGRHPRHGQPAQLKLTRRHPGTELIDLVGESGQLRLKLRVLGRDCLHVLLRLVGQLELRVKLLVQKRGGVLWQGVRLREANEQLDDFLGCLGAHHVSPKLGLVHRLQLARQVLHRQRGHFGRHGNGRPPTLATTAERRRFRNNTVEGAQKVQGQCPSETSPPSRASQWPTARLSSRSSRRLQGTRPTRRCTTTMRRAGTSTLSCPT
eukprot:scaffold2976_cov104-Isochrysis_galbana.AAC.4